MKIPHERWEQSYRTGDTPWRNATGDIDEWIKKAGVSSGVALDLGCGTGDQAIWLSKNGFEVEALDYSAEAIKQAQAQGSKVHFTQRDLEQLAAYPFKHEKYDLILLNKVLAFIENRDGLLQTVKDHLEGVFILDVILEHDEKPAVITPTQELEPLLNKYFTIVDKVILPTREGIVIANYYLK